MPKRRTTKQAAASRHNLEIARRKRATGRPVGKNVLMVHYTSGIKSKAIIKGQEFKPHPHQANIEHVFTTHYHNRKDPDFKGKYGYGHAGVVVSVPRKAIKPDTDWMHPKSFMFHKDAIKGRKIRGLKRGE